MRGANGFYSVYFSVYFFLNIELEQKLIIESIEISLLKELCVDL